MRDALTGLGNRRFFDEELEMSLKSDPVVCLLMCDLDNFKGINDKFGHAVGDMVLKQFADILNAAARRDDLAARVGGEEFAMVMPNISPVEAGRLADHVRRQLEAKKWMVGGSVALGKVTASFGIARRRAGEAAIEFCKRADAALYRAKVGRPQSRRPRSRRLTPAALVAHGDCGKGGTRLADARRDDRRAFACRSTRQGGRGG